MHYYKRNLGDYAKKTGRLSMLQHGAYTLLMDSCYDREEFPTKEQAIEWTWASTSEEVAAVEFVLARFFVLTDGRYVQDRIAEELGKYKRNAEINARIANERETKRKDASTNRARTVHEAPPNHKPLTKNQEPKEQKKEQGASPNGSRLPADWTASPDQLAWARAERSDVDPVREAASFRDYWHAKPGKDGRKTDWEATWRNWIRNSRNGSGKPMPGPAKTRVLL